MALVATVIALHAAQARAAGDAKPCRTPCLAVEVPREAAAKPAEKTAEKPSEKTAAPKPAAQPAPTTRAVAKPRLQATAQAPGSAQDAPREPVAKRPTASKRCSDINLRAAVGEPLSDKDMKTLRSEC